MAPKPTKPSVRNPRRSPQVDTTPLERLLGFHIRVAMMTMRRSFFHNVMAGDVHPGLATLLLLVSANGEASQAELARVLHMNKATLVGLLNRAECEGWLNRRRLERDRRRRVIGLTAEGQKLVSRLARQMERHEQKYLELFSEHELGQLLNYLRRIYER